MSDWLLASPPNSLGGGIEDMIDIVAAFCFTPAASRRDQRIFMMLGAGALLAELS